MNDNELQSPPQSPVTPSEGVSPLCTLSDRPALAPVPPSPAPKSARSKGGAPRANSNAAKHGLRASKLPKEARSLETPLYQFRKHVRELLVETSGEVTTYAEAVLQSAIRHETRAMLAARYLRVQDDLKLEQKLTLLDAICKATDARDKCLERLGLNRLAMGSTNQPSGDFDWDEFDKERTLESRPPDELADENGPGTPADASAAKVASESNQHVETQELAGELRTQGIVANGTDHQPQGAKS